VLAIASCIEPLVWAQPTPSRANGQPERSEQVAEFVLDHLGFSPEHHAALLAGQAIYSGMQELERLEEDVAAAGAVVLVKRRAAPEVVEAFLSTELFKQVHQLNRYDPIALATLAVSPELLFADIVVDETARLRRIGKNPAAELNVGLSETPLFRGVEDAQDVRGSAALAFRRILTGRLGAYVRDGLDGMEDYVRADGRRVSAADEIRSGLSALTQIDVAFDGFVSKLGTPVQREDELSGARRLHWIEAATSGRQVFALLDQSVAYPGDFGIAAEIHFYASDGYNAMLTIAAALPYDDQTLVFAINHTYTEQIRGFGATLRRRIGREVVATALASHLKRVRSQLEGQ
jgi:hypothetical protein